MNFAEMTFMAYLLMAAVVLARVAWRHRNARALHLMGGQQ